MIVPVALSNVFFLNNFCKRSFYLLNLAVCVLCCLPTETPPLAVQLYTKRDTTKIMIKDIAFNFFMVILQLNYFPKSIIYLINACM